MCFIVRWDKDLWGRIKPVKALEHKAPTTAVK